MNKVRVSIILILFTSLLIGCKKEGCMDESATNYNSEAKKDDGSCIYPELDTRDEFIGDYWVSDTLYWSDGEVGTIKNYVLNVSKHSTSENKLMLNNLQNKGLNFEAIVAGTHFSIPSQQVTGPYYITGSGNFDGKTITYETSGDVYINIGIGNKQ